MFIAGRTPDRGRALAAEITDAGGHAHFVQLDTLDQDQWDAAIAEVEQAAGGLHVLLNIVGSNALTKSPDIDMLRGIRRY